MLSELKKDGSYHPSCCSFLWSSVLHQAQYKGQQEYECMPGRLFFLVLNAKRLT